MSGAGWLNLGSLVFGLIAWILPGINLMQHRKADPGNMVVFSLASVGSCAIALCIQIYSFNLLVTKEDWSALMDTSPARVLAATILLGVTLILNVITLVAYHRKTSED